MVSEKTAEDYKPVNKPVNETVCNLIRKPLRKLHPNINSRKNCYRFNRRKPCKFWDWQSKIANPKSRIDITSPILLIPNALGFHPEVLNPDGKTLQFRYLSALAAKFIDNIRINIDNIRINVDDFPAKLVPLD